MVRKNKRYCSVPYCNTYGSKGITFHRFPVDEALKNKWRIALNIGKPLTKWMSVCCKHFAKNDYIVGYRRERFRLKKNAIPSMCHRSTKGSAKRSIKQKVPPLDSDVNMWEISGCEKEKKTYPTEASIKITKMESSMVCDENSLEESTIQNITEVWVPDCSTSKDVDKEGENQEVHLPSDHTYHTRTVQSKATQTEFYDFQFHEILNSDKKLLTFAGVDHDILKTCVKCIETNMEMSNEDYISDLPMRIILVLIKLRLNISFACLAIMFSISPSTCTKYFYSTIRLLAHGLKPAIYWPSAEEIRTNMPLGFQKYNFIRTVLHCIEVDIQDCKCANCKIKSYSHYQGTKTLKWLIGLTPTGLISYISPGYNGETTNKAIFNREALVTKFSPHDGILVDKDFPIEDECSENHLFLLRPPYLGKGEISKTVAKEIADMVLARVYIENSIQKIRSFSIMNDRIDCSLIPYMDDLLTVVIALVNLAHPSLASDIIADDVVKEFLDFRCTDTEINDKISEYFVQQNQNST